MEFVNKNTYLEVHGAVETSSQMLPMQIFIDFLFTHQVLGIPMIRHIKNLGNVPQNGHGFPQDHTIMLNKRQLKKETLK